jgi:hypothetical protein
VKAWSHFAGAREGISYVVLAAAVCCAMACSRPISKIAIQRVDVSREPVQTTVGEVAPVHIRTGGIDWTLTPKAVYDANGVVLGRRRYRYGWNADLAPCDVALAWGDLANSGLYKSVSWSQSDRWYWWRYDRGFPHDNRYIVTHSSNNHLIPATKNLSRAIIRIGKGDHVRLNGYLVYVDGIKDGKTFRWHSSLSRSDEGNGSCEIIYLERLTVGDKLYE